MSELDKMSQEDQWISLADLMTGLMMIFMLIAVAFMLKVEEDKFRMRQVAVLYDEVRQEIYHELKREFAKDLPVWDAEITPDLTVRFRNPEVLFDTGSDTLKPKFEAILSDFFPRYVKIVTQDNFQGTIKEIRIEGHTSSLWNTQVSPEEAYFKNMALSQARTRSTLRFVLELPQVQNEVPWLRQHMTANGLSSSHPILGPDGKEDVVRSQRVEFHIRTDAEAWIANIVEAIKK